MRFFPPFFSWLLILSMLLEMAPPAYAVGTTISADMQVANYTQNAVSYAVTQNANVGDEVLFYARLTNAGAVTASGLTATFSAVGNGLTTPSPAYAASGTMQDGFNGNIWVPAGTFDLDNALLTRAVGDVGAGAIARLRYISVKIPANYNQPSFSVTVNAACANTCSTTNSPTATVNVNVAPTASNVVFSGSSVVNSGFATTSIAATISDPSGLADIATVKADLSPIGGNSALSMLDDGVHDDGAAGDGVYGATGITTLAAAGTYTITITAKDTGNNQGTATGSIIVQSAGSPAVTVNSTSKTTLSNVGGYTSSTINWTPSQTCGVLANQGYQVELGGTGTPDSGTVLSAWDTTCIAATPVNTIITTANLASEGSNRIYIYLKNVNGTSYNFVDLTKDTTAPTVSINSISPSTVYPSQNASIGWSANSAGTFEGRVGGTGVGTGTLFTGGNGTGSYVSGAASSVAAFADLVEGLNTVYMYLTDAGGNSAAASTTVTKDSTPPVSTVTNFTVTDTDNTANSGTDGRDFTFTWTVPVDANTTSNFLRYDLYILPSATTLNLGTHSAITTVAPVGTNTWTGGAGLTTDSAGNTLAGGTYRGYIVTKSANTGAGTEDSVAVSSPVATITHETPAPPVLSSAAFIDSTTLALNFSRPLDTVLTNHHANRITSSTFTVNTGAGTGGVDSVSGNTIFIKLNNLGNPGLTATDLALAQDAVFPLSGSGNSPVSGFSVADQQTPSPISLSSPATSSFLSSSISITYSLPEPAYSGNTTVTFTRTGGVSDPRSPHRIALSDVTTGIHTQTIDPRNFTSQTFGVGDSLPDETIYSVTLNVEDANGNWGTPVTNTNVMYDVVSPSVPVTIHFPSAGAGNNAWTTVTQPTLQWATSVDGIAVAGYRAQVSLLSDFSVLAYDSGLISNSGATSQQTGVLSDGNYYWRVLSQDTAGNTSTGQTVTERFRIDTTGPTSTISSIGATLSSLTATGVTANDGAGIGAPYQYDLQRTDADCASNPVVTGWQAGTAMSSTGLTINTQYCFKIRAIDALSNTGSYSVGVKAFTLANQITGLSNAGGYDSTNGYKSILSWTNQGQSGVKIEQDSGCDGTYESTVFDNTLSTPALPFTVGSLAANTCYQYRVSSYNGDGTLSTFSQPTAQDTTPPAIPTGLSNTSNTTTSITFDWTVVAGANSYNVYDGVGALLQNVATNSVTLSAATNTAKTVKISAISAANGEGGVTSTVTAYASANTPINASHGAITAASILWTWASGGAENAFYAFTTTPAANSGWVSALSWLQATLSENTQYTFSVMARNTDGDQTPSISASAYSAISTPSVFLINSVSSSQVDITTTVANVGSGSSGVFFENTTNAATTGWVQNTTWNNSGLSPNSVYLYRAKARNGDAVETAFSSTSSGYTLANTPSAPLVNPQTGSGMTITVQANGNPNGTQYEIAFSTTGVGDPTSNPADWAILETWIAHNANDTVVHTGLTGGTTYYYRVHARNQNPTPVATSWSNIGSNTTYSPAPNVTESGSHVLGVWYKGNTPPFQFANAQPIGVAYYRWSWDTTPNTSIADCFSGSSWGTGGTLLTDPLLPHGNDFTGTPTGSYYLHTLACNTAHTFDPATGLAHWGPYRLDKDVPTISNNYGSDNVLTKTASTTTLAPVDPASGISEVRFCTGTGCDPFTGTLLASPYQLSYNSTQDTIVRYGTVDAAGNQSAVGSYHVKLDVDVPVISSTTIRGNGVYQSTTPVAIDVEQSNLPTEPFGMGAPQFTLSPSCGSFGAASTTATGYTVAFDPAGCTEGSKTVNVRLADLAGNLSATGSVALVIDDTKPLVTSFTVTDATSGSGAFTNNSTVAISMLATDANGVAKYLVNESIGAPIAGDFSLTAAPASYSITGGEGNRTLYAWALDVAGNISLSASQSIVLDLTNPTETLALSDTASTDPIRTNNLSITTTMTESDANGVRYWLLRESSAMPSVAEMQGGLVARPVTFLLSAGDGVKTVYASVMDSAENITKIWASITLDTTPPLISAAVTRDTNHNGKIDAYDIALGEPFFQTGATTLATGAGFAVAGHTLSSASILNSTTLRINFNETTDATAATPDLTYTASAGDLKDLARNPLANVNSAAVTEGDGAGPVISSMTALDRNGNGKLDSIDLIFSESVSALGNDSANWTVASIPSGGSLTSITSTGATTHATIAIGEGAGAITTAIGSLTVALNTATNVKDTAGNLAQTFTATAPLDGMAPVFTARTTSASGPATVTVTFSEPVSSVASNSIKWNVSGNLVTSITSMSTSMITILSLQNAITNTAGTPTVTYTQDDIKDAANNLVAGTSVIASDGLAPVILSAIEKDSDGNGSLDTISLTFSEAVSDASISAAGFLLNGVAGTSITTGTGNDTLIDVNFATQVPGTSLKSFTYDAAGGGATDLNGNALASAAISASDGAKPVILSAFYNNNGTAGVVTDDVLTLTFSENISDASMSGSNASTNFTVANGGALGTNSTLSTGTANDDTINLLMGSTATELTAGASTIALKSGGVIDSTGNSSSSLVAIPVNGMVVINELFWSGSTNFGASDQYLELRNLGAGVTDISGWQIKKNGVTIVTIPGATTIAGNGFYLISHFGAAASELTVAPDLVDAGLLLDTSNVQYTLVNGAANTVDIVDDGVGAPLAGDGILHYSMERNIAPANGTLVQNWHTAALTTNFDGGSTARGTPASANVTDALPPSFTLSSRYPVADALIPHSSLKISVDYADNAGGSGVNTATGVMTIDGTSVPASISAIQASYTLPAALAAGKHTIVVTVEDNAGNIASTSWDFWIDSFTVSITKPRVNLLPSATSPYTSISSEETQITITTYGAGVDLSGYATQLLTMGGNTIQNWTGATALGMGWDLKTGTGGLFTGTYSPWSLSSASPTALATVARLNAGTYTTPQTYTWFVRYHTAINALQAAGIYGNTVSYKVVPKY